MNWFNKRNKTSEKTTTNNVVTIKSIEEKLANYRPKRPRAVFEEPQQSLNGESIEFKKVSIDLNSSGIQHIPFTW